MAAGLSADVTYVRCESGLLGRYKACKVKTDGQVELVRELSSGLCEQWKSWGFDREGVWVDRGCRAEFRVGREKVAAGTIAAVAGAAILGSILVAKKAAGPADEDVVAPEWASGEFHGFSPKLNADVDITIANDGVVTGKLDGKPLSGHTTKGDGLTLGDLKFAIEQETWGMSAKQKDDADNSIFFRRK